MLVYERSLLGRDFVLRRGTELRERLRQLAPRVAIGVNRVRKAAQVRDGGVFARDQVLAAHCFESCGMSRITSPSERSRHPPFSRIESEIRALSIDRRHGHEGEVFVDAHVAEAKFRRARRGDALSTVWFCVVRRNQWLAGLVGERNALEKCGSLIRGQRLECRGIVRGEIVRELRVVCAACGHDRGGKCGGGLGSRGPPARRRPQHRRATREGLPKRRRRLSSSVGFRAREDGCQVLREFRARHHVGASCRSGAFGEVNLDVRKKRDQRNFRAARLQAFESFERSRARVQVHDDRAAARLSRFRRRARRRVVQVRTSTPTCFAVSSSFA